MSVVDNTWVSVARLAADLPVPAVAIARGSATLKWKGMWVVDPDDFFFQKNKI